jgi:hypothetical protein
MSQARRIFIWILLAAPLLTSCSRQENKKNPPPQSALEKFFSEPQSLQEARQRQEKQIQAMKDEQIKLQDDRLKSY